MEYFMGVFAEEYPLEPTLPEIGPEVLRALISYSAQLTFPVNASVRMLAELMVTMAKRIVVMIVVLTLLTRTLVTRVGRLP
jgi:hypothetical protein